MEYENFPIDDKATKCLFCHRETHGSNICYKCKDNSYRRKFFERQKVNEMTQEILTEKFPSYAMFCDDSINELGFKPARVTIWLNTFKKFKTDKETDLIYYGNEKKGVWIRDCEYIIKEYVAQILRENNKVSHFKNIVHHLRSLTYCDISFSNKIACDNGLLNLETRELTPSNLNEMCFYSIPTAYNPNAVSDSWLKFLNEVVAPEDIPLLQEWSGYLLLPDYRFHKILWIHGTGRNGKGVYQRTMETILGINNVSSIEVSEFDGSKRFSLERLYGRLANFCSEPRTNKILQTSLLKKLTGQDLIEAEIKYNQKRVKFQNCAKITILANKFPKVNDDSVAFKDRMMFISFPNEFIVEKQIPNLENTWLNDPIQKMGIFNWMLEGLIRLLANGKFTESKTQNETQIAFMRASDSINAFLNEMVVYGKNYVVTRTDLYESYKEYCENFGLNIENNRKFTQVIKATKGVTEGKIQNQRTWKSIRCKQISDEGKIIDFSGAEGAESTHPTTQTKLGK